MIGCYLTGGRLLSPRFHQACQFTILSSFSQTAIAMVSVKVPVHGGMAFCTFCL
jgi:hypothetical protein